MRNSFQTLIRDLHRKRGRERRGLALAEGIRLVEDALAAGLPLRGAVASSALQATGRGRALEAALEQAGVPLERVTDAELDALADTEQPQGVVAIYEPRRWSLQDLNLRPDAPALVLAGVQDPGNVGTMIRTALGLGAAGVVALKGTAELTNPKVVRATMGAAFRLPAIAADADTLLAFAREAGAEVWAAAMDGEPVAGVPRTGGPVCIVVGNEGAGIPDELLRAADRRVAIPLRGPADSLNVAIAAGILLYEVLRGQ